MAALLFICDIQPEEFRYPPQLTSENLLEELKSYLHIDTFDASKILCMYLLMNIMSIQIHKLHKYFGVTYPKTKRIAESSWKSAFYAATWSYSVYHILTTEENILTKPYLAWEAWGDTEVLNSVLQFFYLLQISFQIYSLTHILQEGKKEKNGLNFLCLHALLLILFGLLYTLHYYQIGLLVCLFYDAPAMILEVTRINVYLDKASKFFRCFSHIGFSMYTLLWMGITLYLFPVKILYLGVISTMTRVDRPLIETITFFMILLQLYNLYWMLMLLNWTKTMFNRRKSGDSYVVYHFFHKGPSRKRDVVSPSSESSSGVRERGRPNDALALVQTVKCVIRLKRKLKKIRKDKLRAKEKDDTFDTD